MEDLGKQFGHIVEERLRALKTNAFAVEKAFGLPPDAIRNVVRSEKRSGPTLSRVQEICTALDLEIYIGPRRELVSEHEPQVADPDQFAKIPVHAAFLAAGNGSENGTEHIIDFLAFRRDWLRRIGVAPCNAALAKIDGDSMQPSIWDGDLVMIDRARREVPVRQRSVETKFRSPVYALLDDGRAKVKRIERPQEDQVILLSDNPDYAPQVVPASQIDIIGKVVWWGHTSKE